MVLGKEIAIETIAAQLLERIEANYLRVTMAASKNSYLNALYWLNEEREYKAANNLFTGCITNVDATGRLVIKTSEGERVFSFKEVQYIG